MGRGVARRWAVVCAAVLMLGSWAGAEGARVNVRPVSVRQIEPASWEQGPGEILKLRLSGDHLDTVVNVKARHKGVHVVRMEVEDENHLLVWLRMEKEIEAGSVVLQISSRFMTTFAELPMSSPAESGSAADVQAAK